MSGAHTAHDVVAPFSWDLSTGEMHWSTPLYHLYGLCPETDQAGAVALLAAIVPADRHRVWEGLTAGFREGGPFSIRYRLQGPDGKPHELLLTAVGSRMNGVTRYVTGFVVDVTLSLTARLDDAVAASAAHRAAIEQAKGAIMLRCSVTEEEAFLVLRHLSNRHNVRLALLAERIVHALHRRAAGDPTAFEAVATLFGDGVDAVKRRRHEEVPVTAGDDESQRPQSVPPPSM